MILGRANCPDLAVPSLSSRFEVPSFVKHSPQIFCWRPGSEKKLHGVVRDGSLREAMNDTLLPDTVGREYLAQLRVKASRDRERQTKARALSVQVHKLFNPLEEEISCKKVDAEGMLIDIAHLIDSKSIEKYQNRYSTAAKQLKNCQVSVSGPWPPYHFLPGKLRTVAGNS